MFKGALPGFRDFYPQELAERAYIMSTWREVARRYAFVEYDGPPLEPLELYTRKSGDEIVGQLYNFVDKGGREVALRPEMTPTVARMVAARANALRKPVRWFSMPQLFRYERQQKGRLREHYQLNVDLFGTGDLAADAELIACAIDIMRAFDLTEADFKARVSDRRLLEAILLALRVPEAALPRVYALIDKVDRMQGAEFDRQLLDIVVDPAIKANVYGAVTTWTFEDLRREFHGNPRVEPLLDQFATYFGYLEALGVRQFVELDLRIVRGLAYYTGIVFELFDTNGEFRAIAGGGRYDNLLNSLGGADMPALGFGMGDVVLGELLRAKGLMKPAEEGADVWVAADESEPLERVMREAAARRAAGQSVEYALRPQSLSRQKKAAQASGARDFVTLSNDDGRNG
jgi:histidyl-tRNA synthetase